MSGNNHRSELREVLQLHTNESREEILRQIFTLKRDKKLVDVVLVAGKDEKKIPAHRLLLSSCSPYFRNKFTSTDSPENRKLEIRINDVYGSDLDNIIEFCYSGALDMGTDNVKSLFITAQLIQIPEVVNACRDFILRKLDFTNFREFWSFAESQRCASLMEKIKSYVCENFMDISKNKGFLEMNDSQLKELLASDDLSVTNEDDVFLSLMAWFEHNISERKRCIGDLLKLVRVPLFTPTFVVERKDLIFESIGDLEFIKEIFTWHISPEKRPAIDTNHIRPRKWLGANSVNHGQQLDETLLAVEIQNYNGIGIQKYCHVTKKWEKWRQLTGVRYWFGAAIMQEELIIAGGYHTESMLKSAFSINLKTMKSNQISSMGTERSSVCLLVLDDFLYAIGGWNRNISFNIVERWERKTNKWTYVASMNEARVGHRAVTLNDSIYVVGGEHKKSMESYDPKKDIWTMKAAMREVRNHHGVAVLNNFLYAIGGEDNITMERYDPITNMWTMLCSLSESRDRFGCIGFKGKIIIAGGNELAWRSGDLTTDSEYDPDENQWTEKRPLIYYAGPCILVVAKNIS